MCIRLCVCTKKPQQEKARERDTEREDKTSATVVLLKPIERKRERARGKRKRRKSVQSSLLLSRWWWWDERGKGVEKRPREKLEKKKISTRRITLEEEDLHLNLFLWESNTTMKLWKTISALHTDLSPPALYPSCYPSSDPAEADAMRGREEIGILLAVSTGAICYKITKVPWHWTLPGSILKNTHHSIISICACVYVCWTRVYSG